VIPVPESEGGSATILATKAGDVAQDGTGRNGLFTEAFLKNFDAGLSLDQFFLKVRADVVAKTGGQQTPQIQTSGILNGFYLGKRSADQAPLPQQPIPQQMLPAVPVSVATIPQKTTGFVTIVPNANNQSSPLIISATREGTGIVHDLSKDNPNELAEGIYMVSAMLADDIEPVYQRILNIDPGTSVKVNLPAIVHSVAFQRKALVDQKNALIPAHQRAESSAKTKKLIGWLSFGVGLASAGFSAYEYMAGQSAYADYLNATSTSAAESARTLSTTSSTLFSISAVTSGLMFTISPFLLLSDPAKKTRNTIEVIDQNITLLDLEGGKK